MHLEPQPHSASPGPQAIDCNSPSYPVALARMAGAPPLLWVRGAVPSGRAVAVVGARQARRSSVERAAAIGVALARQGVVVISGGALGVDAAAHQGALDGGGRTVVVLGTGIDVVYPPQHGPLFDRIVAAGGAVVSHLGRDQQPTTWSFPARNRVIAGLAEAVIVVEAGAGSGSLYTAAAGRAAGRRVVALLGSSGCDALAAGGALAARSVEAALALALGEAALLGSAAAPTPPAPAEERARALYDALSGTACDLGEAALRAGLRPEEAMALAIDLELGGFAVRAPGGRYLRIGAVAGDRPAPPASGGSLPPAAATLFLGDSPACAAGAKKLD